MPSAASGVNCVPSMAGDGIADMPLSQPVITRIAAVPPSQLGNQPRDAAHQRARHVRSPDFPFKIKHEQRQVDRAGSRREADCRSRAIAAAVSSSACIFRAGLVSTATRAGMGPRLAK